MTRTLLRILTSQAFLIALKNVDRYQFRGCPFSAWLYKIASNEINKHYRKQKQTKVFSIEEGRIRELMRAGR
jgi:RNA polymerase sigma-70 factor (ECF subfamily)